MNCLDLAKSIHEIHIGRCYSYDHFEELPV